MAWDSCRAWHTICCAWAGGRATTPPWRSPASARRRDATLPSPALALYAGRSLAAAGLAGPLHRLRPRDRGAARRSRGGRARLVLRGGLDGRVRRRRLRQERGRVRIRSARARGPRDVRVLGVDRRSAALPGAARRRVGVELPCLPARVGPGGGRTSLSVILRRLLHH